MPTLMTEEERNQTQLWVNAALELTQPFSFCLDGEPSSGFLAKWQRTATRSVREDGTVAHTVVTRDPASGLECILELETYPEYPAVEWVLRFRNTGATDTAIISEVNALDVAPACSEKVQPRLYYSTGTHAKIDDFALQEQSIPDGGKVELASDAARDYLPFFNLDLDDQGVIGAIGWTKRWKCAVQRPSKGANVEVRAGMANTHLRLHPGEEIRTPRILLLFWKGDRLRAHNMLRRHLVAHHLPRPGGKEVEAPICNATWGGMKTRNHLKNIKFITDNGLEYDCYWIDAGWYGPDHETEEFQNFYTEDWAYHMGHWRVNRTVHPDGLRPIADAAHDAGMKLLLWFSPLTAEVSSPILKDHPEWKLEEHGWGKDGIGLNKKTVNNCTLDVRLPEMRQFLVDYLSKLIAEHGMDNFRDDCGLPRPPYEQEAPDRQGIAEIRIVEGFYAFWDELLRRHPGMLIDNCGGGGTRIDLETIGRGLVLHRTDYNCHPGADPIGFQVGTYGLSHWVPLVGGGTPARPGNTFNIRSAWCGGLPFSLFHACGFGEAPLAPAKDYPVEWHRKMLADYRRVRPYFKGDFYPLTNCTLSHKDWFAYQMDRPDLGEGVVVAFRRKDSPFVTADFNLQGLDKDAEYCVEDMDTGASRNVNGQTLMEAGLTVKIADRPGTVAIVYQPMK